MEITDLLQLIANPHKGQLSLSRFSFSGKFMIRPEKEKCDLTINLLYLPSANVVSEKSFYSFVKNIQKNEFETMEGLCSQIVDSFFDKVFPFYLEGEIVNNLSDNFNMRASAIRFQPAYELPLCVKDFLLRN